MIQAAVADVIGPAVAAQDPYALLHQVIGHCEQFARRGTIDVRQLIFQNLHPFALLEDAGLVRLVGIENALRQIFADDRSHFPDQLAAVFILLVNGQAHAQPEFGVVFE